MNNSPTIMQTLINPDFLANLKQEILTRTKPSKSILEALKYYNTINIAYKKQIAQLKLQLQTKNQENAKLLERIKQLQAKNILTQSISPSINIIAPKQQQPPQPNNDIENDYDETIELVMLKARVKYLEQYKQLKETRFTETIERQSKYVGQINMLKYKNQSLQQDIKNLQQTIQMFKKKGPFLMTKNIKNIDKSTIRSIPTNKPIQNATKQYQKDELNEYLNHNDVKSNNINTQIKKDENDVLRNSSTLSVDLNLITSNCNMMIIEEKYKLQNMQEIKNQLDQLMQINEIDHILAEELPLVSSDLLEYPQKQYENLNESMININLNANQNDSKYCYI